MGVGVHGAFDGSENAGDLLPLVEKDGLVQPAKRRVGIRKEGAGLSGPIEGG